MDTNSLSHTNKLLWLARIAHYITVSARSTYVPGTEDIKEPKVLRAYNELLHRVTSSLTHHIKGEDDKFPIDAVLATMQEFADRFGRQSEIAWILKTIESMPYRESSDSARVNIPT
jgi:hypothetical protein